MLNTQAKIESVYKAGEYLILIWPHLHKRFLNQQAKANAWIEPTCKAGSAWINC